MSVRLIICALTYALSLPRFDCGVALAVQPLRVMTFNIWVGGEGGGQPLEQTAAVVRAANADIVGIQESLGVERDGKVTK